MFNDSGSNMYWIKREEKQKSLKDWKLLEPESLEDLGGELDEC